MLTLGQKGANRDLEPPSLASVPSPPSRVRGKGRGGRSSLSGVHVEDARLVRGVVIEWAIRFPASQDAWSSGWCPADSASLGGLQDQQKGLC